MAFYFFDEYGRYILVGFCIFCMAGGVAIICAGMWSTLISISAAILGKTLVFGLVNIFLYYLGYCGAVKRNIFKLKLFAGISIGLTVLGVVFVVLMFYFKQELHVIVLVSTVIQALCIVLAFGLASDITRKAAQPPQCSCVSDNEKKAFSPPKCTCELQA